MAIIYGKNTAVDYAAGNLASFGKSYSRMGAAPLDMTEVWYDKAALEEYAAYRGVEQADGSYDTSSVTSYVGQRVVFVDETANKVYNYSIQLDGGLKEIGTSPIGDGKSIVVADDGTVSLKGITGLVFERDILDENEEPTGEKEAVQYQPLLTAAGLVWVEPSKTTVEGLATLIDALTKRVEAIEKWQDDFEDKDTTYDVKSGEKVLSLEGTSFGTTLKLQYAEGKIKLLGIDDALVSEIDAADFVADGILENVEYNASTDKLIFTWNVIDSETGKKKVVEVSLADLIDTYTAGNGLNLKDNEFSVKITPNEKYLEVDSTGLHTKGIDDAIATAIAPLPKEDTNTTYTLGGSGLTVTLTPSEGTDSEFTVDTYTKKEIDDKIAGIPEDTNTTYAISADGATITLTPSEGAAQTATLNVYTKDEIEAGAQVNVIEKITVNGNEVPVTNKTAVITGLASTGSVQTNAAHIDELEKALYGKVIDEDYPTDSTTGLFGEVSGLKGRVSTVEGTLNTIAEGTYKVPEAVNADTVDGKHANDFDASGAAAQALTDAKNWVTEQDYANNTRVKGLEDRIKAEEDKVDNDTTYSFENGAEGTFKVTAKGGTAQTVNTGAKAYTDTAIASALAEAKKYADDNDADTKYGIVYDKTNKKIKLTNNVSETEIDATDFIKDGMIESVTLSDDGLSLIITWNTDAGKTDVTTIPLSGLVDIYTGVDGSEIKVSVSNDNKISAELKATVTEDIAKGVAAKTTIDTYGDIVTHNASEFAPSDINTGVMSVTSLHDAIVVTPGANGSITINFADEIILNGGGANI